MTTLPISTPPADQRPSTDPAAVIRDTWYGDLQFPSEKQRKAFLSYVRLAQFLSHFDCRRMLELGSGLSSVVLGRVAARAGVRLVTIDIDFSRLQTYVAGTPHAATLAQHVEQVRGATIPAEALSTCYLGSPLATVGGAPVGPSLAAAVDAFTRPHAIGNAVETVLPAARTSIGRALLTPAGLAFPRPLLDVFAGPGGFDAEIAWLAGQVAGGVPVVLDEVLRRETAWDMIFFDCGEFSSLPEWELAHAHIAVGGLAAFHDIYFPKSFKNFVVCASLVDNPRWRILYEDQSNAMGLLVAQRVR